tara:strand:+ start:674 stop:1033 length:360 start_codon:yes stop_codon:yes gene_type:complete
MIVKGTITLKNRNPFCLYKNVEVGIANGYFAGDTFAKTEGHEYITQVSGRKFGWYDSKGDRYSDDKQYFTRPTDEEIIKACIEYDALASIAIEMGLIEMTREEKEETVNIELIQQICLN